MRIRTITKAYQEIKAADPDTAVTEYAIRQAVISGQVPSKKAGTKYLVDLEKLQEYFTAGGA